MPPRWPHALLLRVVRFCLVLIPFASIGLGDDGSEGPDAATRVQRLRPEHHDEFVTRRCNRPTAVLFLGASSKAATEALRQFEAAAGDMGGMACFGALSCEDWPGFCGDLNIRRTPSVFLYPGRPGAAAQPHMGKIEKTKLLAALSTSIASQSQPIVLVKGPLIAAFLLDRLKPFKTILFSRRKAPPVIFQALAGDPELASSVSFGFVPHTDGETTASFNVSESEVPTLIVQHMNNTRTMERHVGGEMANFLALRAWLRGAIRRKGEETVAIREKTGAMPMEAFSDSEVELSLLLNVSAGTELFVHRASPVFEGVSSWDVVRLLATAQQVTVAGPVQQILGTAWVPIAPSGVVELAALSREQVALPPPPEYQQLPYGTKECPPGLAVQTAEECEAAITSLGLGARPSWISNFPGLPSYCSVREKVTSESPERMHFNSAKNGAGREDLAPICRTSPADASADDVGSSAAATAAAAAVAKMAAEAALRRAHAPQGDPSALVGPETGLPHVRGATTVELSAFEREAFKFVKTKPARHAATGGISAPKQQSAGSPRRRTSKQTGKSGGKSRADAETQEPTDSQRAAKKAELRKASAYMQLGYGEAGCPPGLEIRSVDECERAVLSLGIVSRPAWVSNFEGVPSLCSVREQPTKGSPERMHFNSASGGHARADLAPVCKKPHGGAEASGAGASATAGSAAADSGFLPELSGATQEELLGGAGLCFVFLCEGPITAPDAHMLRSLRDRLEPRLQDRGTPVQWMWIDVRAERKMKGVFDPPVLPSAVVLDPGRGGGGKGSDGRPRFAPMQHVEEDGDPRPADAASLELLLNTVLGGDASFIPIPPKRLITGWSKRSG